ERAARPDATTRTRPSGLPAPVGVADRPEQSLGAPAALLRHLAVGQHALEQADCLFKAEAELDALVPFLAPRAEQLVVVAALERRGRTQRGRGPVVWIGFPGEI